MGGGVSTDFKSLNGIEISWFVQVLLNFYWFWQSYPGGWGWGWVCEGVSHACMHAHIHVHTHTHTHIHVKHDKHGCLHVGGHLQFLYMYTCVCMHAHACVHVWRHPHAPRHPPTHLPPPQSCREPKTPKFNKSWTNQDISILFEDSVTR